MKPVKEDTQTVLKVSGVDMPLPPGTVLETAVGRTIPFESLIESLGSVHVVYLGERHDDPSHHDIQLRILQALASRGRPLSVGMEMFDHTYQPKLDRWSAGGYDYDEFLRQVHWYANWKFDDALYREILVFAARNRLRLIGLNVPFHLPPKIAIGGLDSLSESERALVPANLDESSAAHRASMEKVYAFHHLKGGTFETFYQAQLAWDQGMAEAVAAHAQTIPMVVLTGNGHIVKKYGIPDRAYARLPKPFKTVYLAYPGEEITPDFADFIWVTEPMRNAKHR